MSRSIAVKKDIIQRIENRFEGFLFESAGAGNYTFRQSCPDRLNNYLSIFREFYDENGYLSLNLVSTCYNLHSKGIPWFTVGKVKSIGQLMTDKNVYDANTGVYQYSNNKEGLHQAITAVENDIAKYVLPFFEMCHQELAKDKFTQAIVEVMDVALPNMQPGQLESFKQWLRQPGEKDTFNQRPLHPLLEQYLADACAKLGYKSLKYDARQKAVRYCIFLIRDYFQFND